jgi:hypothetical protein
MWIRAALLLIACTSSDAQTLEFRPVTVARGSVEIFRMILKPSADKPIAALQWEWVYREGLRLDPSWVAAGSAAEKVGKSVTCATRPAEGATRRMACILAGGVQPFPEGVLAIIRLEAARDTPAGTTTIQLEKVIAVSSSLESIAIPPVSIPVTIR